MRKRRIKFALNLKDSEQVRSLEELQEHFDLEKIIGYYQDGKLLTWLEDRFYDDEADEIKKLSGDESDLGEQLCRIFHVEHLSGQNIDEPETIAWRKERLEKLKQFTADSSILQHVDWVAFDQDDLEEIIHEEDTNTVYLCQNSFVFPSGILRKKNMRYIGIGKNVEAIIKSREVVDFEALGIAFENVQFDEAYTLLQRDTPDKFFELGENAEEQENFDEAVKWYTKAADMGHAYAMSKLGGIYYSGKSGKKDVTKAFALYQKAADLGNAAAMAWLGVGAQDDLARVKTKKEIFDIIKDVLFVQLDVDEDDIVLNADIWDDLNAQPADFKIIIAEVERTFCIEIDEDILSEINTVEELVDSVYDSGSDDDIRFTGNVAEADIIISNEKGFHARPVSLFAITAREFLSEVQMVANGRTVDAKNVLLIMSLGITKGTKITIRAIGDDCYSAVEALRDLIEQDFDVE